MAKVKVYVTLKPTLLDAQGRVVQTALENLGHSNIDGVRIGKFIEVDITPDGRDLKEQMNEICHNLLSNPVIENYRFEVEE